MGLLARVLVAGVVVGLAATMGASAAATVVSSQWVIVNGQRWALYKVVRDGREEHLFRGPGGVTLTLAEMAARFPSPAVDPELSAKAARLSPTAPVRVVAVLRNQPIEAVVARVDQAFLARVRALKARADGALMRAVVQRGRLSAADVRAIREIAAQWRQLRRERNAQILAETARLTGGEQATVADYMRSLGGRGYGGFRMVNMVAGIVPAQAVAVLASHPLVAHVAEDTRARSHLNVSIPSIGADTSFWAAGFTGGIWDVGIVDTGVDTTHPAFAGKTFSTTVSHATASTDPCYVDNPSSGDDLHGHGTHVAGIVMSQGASECTNCRGVARGLDLTYNLKAGFLCSDGNGYMYWSDGRAAIDAAGAGPEAVNLSYGGSTTSDYTSMAQWIDAAVRNFGFDFTISAGNSGPSNTLFSDPAVAYNAVAVASMNDQGTTSRSDDRISSFSSRGPTASGRRKPDLSAPGQSILAPRHTWEIASDFVNFSGTSMAAPHVAGAFVLLWDAGLSTLPTHARKAVLINNADAWSDNGTPSDSTDDGPVAGSQWNRTYGWGYLNLSNAYAYRLNVGSGTVGATDPEDNYFVVADMSTNQKATLVWEKRNVYSGTSIPAIQHTLTDVDLYMYRESTNALLASSISSIDNVEQVAAPTAARMVLKADVFGGITGATTEPVSIAVQGSNFEVGVRGPTIRMTSTPVVCPGATFTAVAQMRHWGNIASHNNSATLSVPLGFTLNSGANPQTFSFIAAGARGTATWSITAPSSGSGVFGNTGQVSSYGETWTLAHNLTVAVQNPVFGDVGCAHPFYGWIQRLVSTGVTAGCGGGNYCPDSNISRAQMAVFIILAMGESPAPCSPQVFGDVPPSSFACGHINRLAQLGVVAGCGGGNYCPNDPVTRAQMAVFIVKARQIGDARWTPWARPTPTFSDVPFGDLYQPYIERLVLEQVTEGCGPALYCPSMNITRGQMAVFIVKAFPSQW